MEVWQRTERSDRATGIHFSEQTPASLKEAVREFLAVEDKFDRQIIRRNADRFSKEAFTTRIVQAVNEAVVMKMEEGMR